MTTDEVRAVLDAAVAARGSVEWMDRVQASRHVGDLLDIAIDSTEARSEGRTAIVRAERELLDALQEPPERFVEIVTELANLSAVVRQGGTGT